VCPHAACARRPFLVSLSSPRSNPSSPDTFICSSIVQMHYQMQMHGRRPERPLIPKGAPSRTRSDTGALLGGRPLPLGYGGRPNIRGRRRHFSRGRRVAVQVPFGHADTPDIH
jgi:hypothetical protein